MKIPGMEFPLRPASKILRHKQGWIWFLFEAYPHGFTDASPLVTKIKASGAQALFPSLTRQMQN